MAVKFKKLPSLQTKISDPKELKRTVDTIYQNVQQNVDNLSSLPVVNGNLMDLDLQINKVNKVAHRLGRKYTDFTLYQSDTGVKVWISSETNDNPDKFILLQASTSCHVTLWII